MTAKNNLSFSQEQIVQATDWVLAMSENPDVANNAQFVQWLNHSKTNLLAFNEVALTYELTATLPQAAISTKKEDKPTPSGSRLKAPLALAASLALCCFLLLMQAPVANAPQRTAFTTAIGNVSSFTLEDGTSLTLDTNSRADALITDTHRNVQLKQGRLFVNVAHDKTRQFAVVINDSFAFTALGTAYSVDKNERNWTLEVYEGTVGIASTMMTHTPVKAGWGLRYENHKIQRYALPGTLGKTAPNWQQNRIVFDNTSLRDAVRQFNRYITKPIKINSAELASRSISGTFDLNDSQAFMASIIQLTGATVLDTSQQYEIEAISTTTPEK